MRIRDIFRVPPGETFVIADFKQVELLLAATIAARETGMEPTMLNVFREGKHDIHALTAAAMVEKPIEEVTKDERTRGKAVNFGMLYGAKAERLKEQARTDYKVDMTIGQATKYREAFFERYPEIRRWHDLVDERCSRGEEFSTTPLGRRRKLPKWASSGAIASTTGKNSPVQGAGADAIKLAMAMMFEDREGCPGAPRLRGAIHDEVVLSVAAEHADEAARWVERHMLAAVREALKDPESPGGVEVEVRDRW
jgi:DNA polymerase-1